MKKDKRPFGHILNTVKSWLLGVLLISLVVLVVVYIQGSHVYETMVENRGSEERFDMLWSVQGGIEPEGLDPTRLLPEFVGYKQSSSAAMRGCVGDIGSVSELYGLIKPCLMELFGNGSMCSPVPSEVGRKQFEDASSGEEFVYLRYHTPVLYQLIYAYAADQLIVAETDVAVGKDGNVGAYICELIIVPDKDLAAHRFVAYARDGEGNFYEFIPGKDVVSSSFYISKLASGGNNISTYEFEFVRHSSLMYPQTMIKGEIKSDLISAENVKPSELDGFGELLRLFGYNPDKLDGYSDGDAQVYIDGYSQLRIEPNSLRFLTSDAHADRPRGIGIDTLLGYTVEGTPTLFNKLTAVDNLVRRLGAISPELTGGGASLCLGDVYIDGGFLVVEYILTYNGISVGSEPHVRAVLTDTAVCELTLSLLSVHGGKDTELILGADYVMDKLYRTSGIPKDGSVESFRLCYRDGSAHWTAVLKEEN